MEQNKQVKLSTGKSVLVRTWPMRPSLAHFDFFCDVTISLSQKMGVQELSLDQLISKAGTLKGDGGTLLLSQIFAGIKSLCAANPDRFLKFISDGVDMTPEEVDQLSIADAMLLAWEVGQFNLRPMLGLFDHVKKSRAKSTPPLRS